MRRSRVRALLAAGALAVTASLVGVVSTVAAAGVSAPYNAFTLDPSGPGWLTNTTLVYDDSNATFGFGPYGAGINLSIHTPQYEHFWTALVAPPTGGILNLGTYPTLRSADATHALLDVFGDGRGCNQDSGSVTITELTRDPSTQEITTFAASYSQQCEMSEPPVNGELRWHASQGYAAVMVNQSAIDLGTQPVGSTFASTIDIIGAGSMPVTLGTAAFTGSPSSWFAIAQDGCSGQSLDYGESCHMVVTATPGSGGTRSVTLVMPDNTTPGHRSFAFSITGTSTSDGTVTPASLDFGVVQKGQTSSVETVTVTSVGPTNLVLGSATVNGPNASAFTITANTCSGKSLASGATCTVGVKASPSASGTASATLIINDNSDAGARSVPLTVRAPSAIDVTVTPSELDFGTVPLGQTSAGQSVKITSIGTKNVVLQDATLRGGAVDQFDLSSDSCSGATLAPGANCTITVVAHPNAAGSFASSLFIGDNTPDASHTVALSVSGIIGAQGTYYPLPPQRILDTRTGNGAPQRPLGGQGTLHLQVAGRGGVPATGAGAVVLNVTVTGPTVGGYLTVFPTGISRPVASNLNFAKDWTGANSVTVSLGTNGQIDIFNWAGNTQVIVDVVGFYAADDTVLSSYGLGGQFQPFKPFRVIDTRLHGGALPPKYYVDLPIDFGEYNSHIRAFAVNVTAVTPSGGGYLTAWNGVDALPGTSTLNFPKGAIVPNMAIVPAAPCVVDPSCYGMPSIGVYNGSSGYTHLVVDVVGVYDDSSIDGGLRFHPMAPTRIVDSRKKQGVSHALIDRQTVNIIAPSGVRSATTYALAMNVTAVAPTRGTYLTAWPGPAGSSRPIASNLNVNQGQVVPNSVICGIGADYDFNVYNNAGKVDLVVDVSGTFDLGITAVAPVAKSALSKTTFKATSERRVPLSGTPTTSFRRSAG